MTHEYKGHLISIRKHEFKTDTIIVDVTDMKSENIGWLEPVKHVAEMNLDDYIEKYTRLKEKR